MGKSVSQILESAPFKELVRKKWSISIILTILLFIVYYGYILLIGYNKPLMAGKIGTGATTLGIPLGVLTILGAWVLTAIYVVWANRVYDPEVKRLRDELHK